MFVLEFECPFTGVVAPPRGPFDGVEPRNPSPPGAGNPGMRIGKWNYISIIC
jgi:hypothetical protein